MQWQTNLLINHFWDAEFTSQIDHINKISKVKKLLSIKSNTNKFNKHAKIINTIPDETCRLKNISYETI